MSMILRKSWSPLVCLDLALARTHNETDTLISFEVRVSASSAFLLISPRSHRREQNEGAICQTSVIRPESEKLSKPSIVIGPSEIILPLERRDRSSSLYIDERMTDCCVVSDCC